MNDKFCRNCRIKVHIEAVICPDCGTKLAMLKQVETNQNP